MSDPMNRPNPDPTRGNGPPPVEPAIRDGKAIASTVQVPVEFTLDQR